MESIQVHLRQCCLFFEFGDDTISRNYCALLEIFRLLMVFNFIPVPRDIRERGRDLDQVLHQYMNFVKPAFEDFCMPVSIARTSQRRFFCERNETFKKKRNSQICVGVPCKILKRMLLICFSL